MIRDIYSVFSPCSCEGAPKACGISWVVGRKSICCYSSSAPFNHTWVQATTLTAGGEEPVVRTSMSWGWNPSPVPILQGGESGAGDQSSPTARDGVHHASMVGPPHKQRGSESFQADNCPRAWQGGHPERCVISLPLRPHLTLCISPIWLFLGFVRYNSGPQPFCHQKPVSWRTGFPWSRGRVGSGGERWDEAGEASPPRSLLPSCCVAWFLMGNRVPCFTISQW